MHWLSLTDTEAVRENSGDTVWIHHICPRQSDSIMCNGICAKSEIWHWQMVLVLMKCEVWNIVKLHNRARLWFLRRRDGTWPTESMNCLNTWSNFSLLWKFNKNPIHTQHWNQRFEKHLNGDKKKKKKADLDSPLILPELRQTQGCFLMAWMSMRLLQIMHSRDCFLSQCSTRWSQMLQYEQKYLFPFKIRLRSIE